MRRHIAIAIALMLLAVSASPALARRTGSNVSPAGSIQVWLSPVKGDPSICALKVGGKGLASPQGIFIVRAEDWNGLAVDIGTVNDAGTLDQSNTSASRSDFSNGHTVLVVQGGWYPALGTDGQPASWSVSNTCKPA